MINSYPIIGVALTALLIQGCNAGPDTPRPVSTTPKTVAAHQKPESSVSEQDRKFITMLQELSRRNPAQEAQQSIASGERNIMGYYAGRGGLKLPGLTLEQQASQRCTLKTLDGLGDVIYGKNHLKYRVALRRFAKAYNIAMLPNCL